MATACDDKIPRVNAKSLELRAFASEDWQVTCEKLTLSLCRHNVCVVKGFSTEVTVTKAAFHEMSGLLWGTSWIGDSAAGKLQQSLATTEEEPGLLVQPGRHSYTFKLGCSKAEHLTSTQALSCEWVNAHTKLYTCAASLHQHELARTVKMVPAGVQRNGLLGAASFGSCVPLMPCALAL